MTISGTPVSPTPFWRDKCISPSGYQTVDTIVSKVSPGISFWGKKDWGMEPDRGETCFPERESMKF